MDRRQLLAAGAACTSTALIACAGGRASAAAGISPDHSRFDGPSTLKGDFLNLTTPEGNREAEARIMGNTDMHSTKYGWFKGIVSGVRPGEKIRELIGFSGMSSTRLLPMTDGSPGYRKVLREVGFYTDLETGDILESWHNPYLDETVKVVPIANDPFNAVITAYTMPPPKYGGLNTEEPKPQPLMLDWTRMGEMLMLDQHVNLFYPAALQPDKWPRESGHRFNQVTETFMYQMRWADMQNPDLTSVEVSGSWLRVTPWLPWMLMGPSTGHCLYTCFFGAKNTLDNIDPKVLDYVRAHYPKYLEAPTEWVDPSLSSLEQYAHEQTPAPLPPDGKIPVAPTPPAQ